MTGTRFFFEKEALTLPAGALVYVSGPGKSGLRSSAGLYLAIEDYVGPRS